MRGSPGRAGIDLSRVAARDLAFLVGAGGSRRAGLPVALEVLDQLLTVTVSEPRARRDLQAMCRPWNARRHPYDYLRFEAVLSRVSEFLDPDLDLLSIFDLAPAPSPLQRRLAELACAGAALITVNFDDLLERAIAGERRRARTLNAHAPADPQLAQSEVAVLKLHGSLWRHAGGARRRTSATVQTTLQAVAAHSPDTILSSKAMTRFDEAVRGRVLVVIGYSAADDLDVVPALADLHPRAVVWIDHSHGRVREVARRERGNSRDDALRALEGHASETRLVRGPTERVLRALGLGAVPTPPPPELPWRKRLEEWGAARRSAIAGGTHFAAVLYAELERYDRAYTLGSSARAVPDTPWRRAARAHHLVEWALLGHDLDSAQLLRLANRAVALARRDDDRDSEGYALLALGRVRARRREYEDAADAYEAALGLADERSFGWAQTAQRLANLLVFTGDFARSLDLLIRALRILRRVGLLGEQIDAHHTLGMVYRETARVPEAAAEFERAATLARRFPTGQQLFAAVAMQGEALRMRGDLTGARDALESSIAIARDAPVLRDELATAHDFLGRVELDAERLEPATRHFRIATTIGRRASGADARLAAPGLLVSRLQLAEAHLHAGRRAPAFRIVTAVAKVDGSLLAGEPAAKLHLLEFVRDRARGREAAVAEDLIQLREEAPTVFVDHCATLARLGAATDAFDSALEEAARLLGAWGNRRLETLVVESLTGSPARTTR